MRNSLPQKKLNHSRVQYQAKKLARIATITNRSAPPLRPNVVERVAQTLTTTNNSEKNVRVITNGGIQNIQQAQQRLENCHISGVMVGRAIINHPCSFTNMHEQLFLSNNNNDNHSHDNIKDDYIIPTRGQVIEQYMEYCTQEEEEYKYKLSQIYPRNIEKQQNELKVLSRQLLAVPFALFTGEEGHDSYQRTIRKLNQKKKGQMTTAGILQAALRYIPSDVLHNQLVTDVSSLHTQSNKDSNENYIKYAVKRSDPLQRVIF